MIWGPRKGVSQKPQLQKRSTTNVGRHYVLPYFIEIGYCIFGSRRIPNGTGVICPYPINTNMLKFLCNHTILFLCLPGSTGVVPPNTQLLQRAVA
jgi:hypothetical protein